MDQQYDHDPHPHAISNDMPLTATLTAAEWNIVQAGLHELPMKYAAALVQKISRQIFAEAYGNRPSSPFSPDREQEP